MRLSLAFVFCLLCCTSVGGSSAWAGTAKKEELLKLRTELQQQKQHQAELAHSQAEIEAKLDQLQREMVRAGTDIQEQERVMLALHDRQLATAAKIEKTTASLHSQRETLARTIIALQRLNRMPPQAVLARPSAPIDMARSFDLLQKIIPAVSARAAEIRIAVAELQKLQDEQHQQETTLAAEKTRLAARQAKMEQTLKQRQDLLAENRQQQDATNRQVASLAGRARDLEDLVEKIEKAPAPVKKPMVKAAKSGEKPAEPEKTLVTEAPKLMRKMTVWLGEVVAKPGSARMPVTGRIATAYGQSAGEGIVSQGVTIAARPGAIVTAPSGGTVRFAGPFRQYKLLVIIQHPNGEHSLLGGMQQLYTRTGAQVDAGEPLGKLPDIYEQDSKMAGDSHPPTSLYYERRRNGKPIDPRTARG